MWRMSSRGVLGDALSVIKDPPSFRKIRFGLWDWVSFIPIILVMVWILVKQFLGKIIDGILP